MPLKLIRISDAGQYALSFDEDHNGMDALRNPLTVEIEAGNELLQTGDTGIQTYAMGEMLLIGASAILLLYKKLRCGREEDCSP